MLRQRAVLVPTAMQDLHDPNIPLRQPALVLGGVIFWSVLERAGIPQQITDFMVEVTLIDEGAQALVVTTVNGVVHATTRMSPGCRSSRAT